MLLYKATYSNSYIHWWRWLQWKVLTSTSGAVWGSVSCPRTLWHAYQRNQTSDIPMLALHLNHSCPNNAISCLEEIKGIFRCKFNPWSNTPWHWVWLEMLSSVLFPVLVIDSQGFPTTSTLQQESGELYSLCNSNLAMPAEVWCLELYAATLFVLLL